MDTIVWTPPHPQRSQMWQLMQQIAEQQQLVLQDYQAFHTWSIQYPELFWQAICTFFAVKMTQLPSAILYNKHEMIDARWFSGAELNFAEHLLRRRDEHVAIINVHENGQRSTLTYQQLYQQVAQCAAGLKALGVNCGDRVVALMPNTATTIIAMLATASLGAIWSSCSPDFGAQAAIDRLGQVEPKVLFICDGHGYQGKYHDGCEKINQLAKAITSLEHIVICPSHLAAKQHSLSLTNSLYWNDFIKPATECNFIALPFAHPLYILFSSGTTGKPKCIMHSAGGTLLQHLKELGLHTDLSAQDNLCFYTTCGWMMWNWMVSALALGTTLTLYEGSPSYPTANRLFELIEQEKITVLGTSAKFISAVEKAGIIPQQEADLSSLRCILSTGSPLLPKNYDFVYEAIKKDTQLCSISGGTDIVSCFALGNPLMPIYRGELQCLGLGMAVAVYDENGKAVEQIRGELVCTQPFPSMPIGFWHDDNKTAYKNAYFSRFPGVWAHGDFAELTAHQGLIIYGRSDAVLNPGGVRIERQKFIVR